MFFKKELEQINQNINNLEVLENTLKNIEVIKLEMELEKGKLMDYDEDYFIIEEEKK